MNFGVASLSADGFTGWLSRPDARASGAIPVTGGVYVVPDPARDPVAFLAASPAGRFKLKASSVLKRNLMLQSHI